MKACPFPDELRAFLDEGLGDATEGAIRTHLEECPACRGALDRLVLGEGPANPLATWSDQALLRRLAENAPSCPTTRSGPALPERREIVFPLPPTPEAPLGGLEGFDVLAKLGEGSYGVVFKAHDRRLDRLVALKVLRPELAALAEVRQRFEREARAAAAVKNPYVVVIHDVLPASPGFAQPLLVLEYVEGEPLSNRLRPGGLEPREAAQIALQVARGLTAAHGRGVVHRDIKPDNILLEKTREADQVKIADFGIARGIEELRGGVPPSGEGTRGYMSPEARLAPARVDGRSDLYSLGATLYQLLTGRLPHERLGPGAASGPPPGPRALNSRVARDLDAITLKCLAPEREERYETAAEVADHLGRWLRGEPVPVRAHGALERLGLWGRRSPWVAGLLAVLALVLAGTVAALFAWQQERFRRERDLQDVSRQEELRQERALQEARRRSATLEQSADEQWRAADFHRAGAFAGPHQLLGEALAVLPQDARFADARGLLADRHERAGRLAACHREFLSEADAAWFLSGEEAGGEARRACERALGSFGVLQYADWWSRPPAADLTADQGREMRREVYRLLLLLAGLRIQQGMQAFEKNWQLTHELADASRAALDALRPAQVMEKERLAPPSYALGILRKGAEGLADLPRNKALLKGLLVLAPPAGRYSLPADLDNDADLFFLGVTHVFLSRHQGKDPVLDIVRYLGPGDFDYRDPKGSAERLLRRAVESAPRQYWSWFMLGRILGVNGDFGGAELAFGHCVSLRPAYSRGYEQRGLALVQRALQTKDPGLRRELIGRAERDSQKAGELAPDDPSTYWVRGRALQLLGHREQAVDAYARALILEDRLQERISRRHQLDDVADLIDAVLRDRPGDAAALSLRGLYFLGKGETAKALATLDQIPSGRSVLARLSSARAREESAQAERDPQAHRQALRQALAHYEAIWGASSAGQADDWRQAEARKGRARVLERLGSPDATRQPGAAGG
jgi:tetratricopeptide (TPR) repeat protein